MKMPPGDRAAFSNLVSSPVSDGQTRCACITRTGSPGHGPRRVFGGGIRGNRTVCTETGLKKASQVFVGENPGRDPKFRTTLDGWCFEGVTGKKRHATAVTGALAGTSRMVWTHVTIGRRY
jgi:hypothetical protein